MRESERVLLGELRQLNLLACDGIVNRREIFALEGGDALFDKLNLALGLRVARILNREESACWFEDFARCLSRFEHVLIILFSRQRGIMREFHGDLNLAIGELSRRKGEQRSGNQE